MNLNITENPPTICLNMIVKNESHIIKNTLEKLCNKIKFDYWVICDTGSTDNTPQIIMNFFQEKAIKGELFYDEWVNFAHNRTLALKRAYKKTQLLLIFDADDEIVGNIQIPTNVLFDEYNLKFGSPKGVMYTRPLLINNYKMFEFLSVIHEYLTCKEPPSNSTIINGDYYVESGRTGNRSLDPAKYLKDALILEKAYKEAVEKNDVLFHRYAYYCANSYRDCGRFEDAIKWYKITLNHEKQWVQEKYTSCLYIYQCYTSLKQEDAGFFYLVKSLKYDNERVECLFPLLVYYCCENMYNVAYNYYLIVKDFFENKYLTGDIQNKLFVNIDKYNFFVPYYMILIADKVKDFKCVVKMFEIIFTKKQHMFDKWYIKNVLYNLQFFFQYVSSDNNNNFITLANNYIDFLNLNNVNVLDFDFLKNDIYINAGLNIDKYFPKQQIKSQKFSKNECMSSKNILFYTGFMDINWNYSLMFNKALGGSEKAVAYISQYFPKDYNIFISGSVEYEKIENVIYIPLHNLKHLIENTPFHTIIISRYISFYEMFQSSSFYQSYIWAHDIELLHYGCSLNSTQILTKWNKHINGCICLTEWHKNLFIEKYPILTNKINIINNGININSFKQINNTNKIKNKFIYTSRPDRGLNVLLKLWREILDKMPDATLSISHYGTFPSTSEYLLLKNIINNTNSITYLGNLKNDKLYEEMSSSEYWLYPTHWPETSCITALEMLISEVICLYYPIAGLPFTIDKYGIQVTPNSEINTILSLTDEQKTQLRKNGKVYAKSCSWKNRYKMWKNILFNNNPKEIIANVSQETIENVSQETIENVPKEIIENVPKETIENVPQETIENVSQETIENVSQETIENVRKEDNKINLLIIIRKEYSSNMVLDYVDSLTTKYNVTFTSDLDYARTLTPNKVLFIFGIWDDNTYNYFYKKNIEVSILNLEPLNLKIRLIHIMDNVMKYTGVKIYDYSKSNIKILDDNGYNVTEHLPYQIYEEETNLLKKLNECTEKVYDFGIILAEYPKIKRRSDVVNFLIENNYSFKIIQGWKNIRDEQIASCCVLLNIHGFFQEDSKIFEHIRCDRLLAAGYKILSETSVFLDEIFINQYKNNLKIVEYSEFFNKELYDNLDWVISRRKQTNKKIFCVIHSCTLKTTGTNVLDYIVEVINKTGFIDVVDNVFINNIGLPIENKYQNNKYIVTNYSDNTQLFEYPSLNKVKTIALNNPDSNILYLHTKGISHTNINRINYIADWTNLMLHFLVEKHLECINKLNEGYDTIGCNYIERNQYTDKKHFSGNFWWSNSTYINKLDLLDENRGHRGYAEFWLFTENPSHYNIYSSNIDHYIYPYPMEIYSQNSIIKQIISK